MLAILKFIYIELIWAKYTINTHKNKQSYKIITQKLYILKNGRTTT